MPHELQPWIFRYGAAMPFFNVGRVVRTVRVDTLVLETQRADGLDHL